MKTATPMGKDHCPNCNKTLDHATSVFVDKVPMPGDLSICVGCASYLTYSEDMALKTLSSDEFAKLSEEQRCGLIQLRTLIRLKNNKYPQP